MRELAKVQKKRGRERQQHHTSLMEQSEMGTNVLPPGGKVSTIPGREKCHQETPHIPCNKATLQCHQVVWVRGWESNERSFPPHFPQSHGASKTQTSLYCSHAHPLDSFWPGARVYPDLDRLDVTVREEIFFPTLYKSPLPPLPPLFSNALIVEL